MDCRGRDSGKRHRTPVPFRLAFRMLPGTGRVPLQLVRDLPVRGHLRPVNLPCNADGIREPGHL